MIPLIAEGDRLHRLRTGRKVPWKVLLVSPCLLLIFIYLLKFENSLTSSLKSGFVADVHVVKGSSKKATPDSDLILIPSASKTEEISDDDLLYEITLIQDNFEQLEQTDPKLIRYARARYLTPPPTKSKLKDSKIHKSPFTRFVRTIFKDKRNGIFLEAGANDGKSSSHTLKLENDLDWSGILVECNPQVVPDLKNSGRKAWIAAVCLSTSGYPNVVNMSVPISWTYSARLGPAIDLAKWGVNSNWTYYDGIESVPLYTILAAAGIKEVDFFSFDIEGSELGVLRSFPFDKVLIKVMILEVHFYTKEERRELKQLLEKNGLIFIKEIEMDEIYVHESLIRDGVTVKQLATLRI